MAVEDERFEAYLAAGKALSLLTQRSQTTLGLERGSVYGAAVALPQFARTSGWSLHYTAWAFRGYLFLVMNLTLQGFLIFMISKEERINDKFGGQMHLCDFGAHIENCPDTSNCVGPGGTVYTPDRLYNWEMWAIRVYVRDSLLKLFPHREAEVNLTVDPGEYGLESYNLRAMCCFIFLIGLWPDLIGSLNLLHLLFRVPTKDEPWILYEKPGYEDTDELSGLSLRIAGMPLGWKIANFVLVWVPKVYIWILTIDVGILFLMETAQIEDMVINAVSLAFILSLDELIFESMFNDAAKKMMESLEDFSEQPDDKTNATDMEVYEAHMRNRGYIIFRPAFWKMMVPIRFCLMMILLVFFLVKYYSEHCVLSEALVERFSATSKANGYSGYVSADVYLPKNYAMSMASFVFGPWPKMFPVPVEKRVWSFTDNLDKTGPGGFSSGP